MRIVVADDVAENRLLLEALLGGNGYQVALANNGREALEELERAGADLVISDILMPVMDGYQLIRAMKADERFRSIPVVFYTATYTSDEDRDFALGLGASRFIVKPMAPEEFIVVVREVLDAARRGRLPPGQPAIGADPEFLREHSQRVGRKLDKKVEELDATRRLLQEVFQSMGEGLAVIGSDYRIRLANPAYAALAGVAADALAGMTCYEATRCRQLPCDDPECRCPVRETFRSGQAAVARHARPAPDGRTVETEVRSYPMRDPSGLVTSAIEIVRDISGERHLEAQLAQAQKMEPVGQLAGGVAHDFNNILGVIMGYASLIAMSPEGSAPGRLAPEILEACQRGAQLTRSLLAFSRKQALEVKPVALAEIIDGTVRLLRHVIGEDVEVRTALRDDRAVLLADAGLLQQALVNLATNARDAMPGGGVFSIETARTLVDAQFVREHGFGEPGPHALIVVGDTGCGMDETTRARAFEPFFTTKEHGRGTGLGLSMVYGTIRQHGGFITLTSAPGAGTTFRIYLPLAAASDTAPPPRAPAPWRGGDETILVAEDDPALRQLSREVLEHAGYTVLSAGDGEEALRLFRAHRDAVRLVLLDAVMPKMGGGELGRRLRAEAPGLRTLYMSGYPPDLLRGREGLEPGCRLVMKPLRVDELLRRVREELDAPAPRADAGT